MAKSFLNIPYITIGASSRAWIKIKDVARHLDLGERHLRDRILFSNAAPFRAIRPRSTDFLKMIDKGSPFAKPREDIKQYFDFDFLLAAIFTMSHEPARKMRDQVVYILNSLAYDGFVSLKNYYQPLEIRRSIVAYVAKVDHIHDVIKTRWDSTDVCRGSALAPNELTIEKLSNPDFFLNRHELTQIKAIDLAIYLIMSNCYIVKEDRDSALDSILDMIGIERSAGQVTDEQQTDLVAWVETHHAIDHTPIL